jgi:hypothetical protein
LDAAVFKANLRDLLASRSLTQKDLADRIGGESDAERHSYYRWLRRTCSQGLTRCEDRNRDQLQRLCDFFGIHPVERLWSRRLTELQNTADEYVDMLRFILQSPVPLDGIGVRRIEGVDGESLKQQIRWAYEHVLDQSEGIVNRGRWIHNEHSMRELERRRNEYVPHIDRQTITAKAMARIKDRAQEGSAWFNHLLKLFNERELQELIQRSLNQAFPSMRFEQVWTERIVPHLEQAIVNRESQSEPEK